MNRYLFLSSRVGVYALGLFVGSVLMWPAFDRPHILAALDVHLSWVVIFSLIFLYGIQRMLRGNLILDFVFGLVTLIAWSLLVVKPDTQGLLGNAAVGTLKYAHFYNAALLWCLPYFSGRLQGFLSGRLVTRFPGSIAIVAKDDSE